VATKEAVSGPTGTGLLQLAPGAGFQMGSLHPLQSAPVRTANATLEDALPAGLQDVDRGLGPAAQRAHAVAGAMHTALHHGSGKPGLGNVHPANALDTLSFRARMTAARATQELQEQVWGMAR
jgi:hypothetical protein